MQVASAAMPQQRMNLLKRESVLVNQAVLGS